MFRLLNRYNVSRYLRSFYFIKSVIIQSCIDGNQAYFFYVCFSHLSYPFAITIIDKFCLVLTLLFLLFLVLFSLTYYFLLGEFLKKESCYFIFCLYRFTPSYLMLTIKFSVRSMLQGVIHFFFYYHYGTEIILLCLVEVAVILTILIL